MKSKNVNSKKKIFFRFLTRLADHLMGAHLTCSQILYLGREVIALGLKIT